TSLNGTDTQSDKVGADLVFMNREVGLTQSGQSTTHGIAASGTSGNWYNANSYALAVTGQGRAEAGATYVGWNRGIRFKDNWGDVAKVAPWSSSRTYQPGDYVTNGGNVWLAREVSLNFVPVQSPQWSLVT